MSSLMAIVLAWLAVSIGLLAALQGRRLLALWREPVLAYPVVIVESDDWGPGPAADAEMLREIAATLGAVRDAGGRPAVMTLGVVLGVPDGAAILSAGGRSYVRRTLADPAFAAIVAAMREGCAGGVFALQRHGLEHFWPAALLARLDDGTLRAWLADPLGRSESLPAPLQSRWIDASRLPSERLDPAAVAAAAAEEAAVFEQVFGEVPEVAVPNTFVWDDATERAWAACGVRYVVTAGWRYEGRDEHGRLLPPTRRILNGERGRGGLTYVVRNDYFEPFRGHRAERVWEAIATRGAQGRPTLLETHRESFVTASADGRAAVGELGRALRIALARYPDLRFLSTAELARHLADPQSPLVARDFAFRLRAWLCRLSDEAVCARLLKLTGLAWPLGVARWLLGVVTHGGFRAARTC